MPGVAVCLDLACGKAQGARVVAKPPLVRVARRGWVRVGSGRDQYGRGSPKSCAPWTMGGWIFGSRAGKFVPFDSAIEKKSIYTLNY